MSETADAAYLASLDNTLADEYVGVYEALAYRTPSWLGSKPGLCWVDTHGNVIHTDHCTGHDLAAETRRRGRITVRNRRDRKRANAYGL